MGFLLTNWTKFPVSMNSGKDTGGGQITPAVGGPNFFGYQNSTDAAATVDNANYFSEVAFEVCVGDFIFANCADAFASFRVATVDRTVNPATVTVETLGLATAIGTANIQDAAVTTAKIADGDVTLAKLDAGITPSHVVKFADQETTVGGAAAEAFTVTGVAATDLAFVQVVDNGTGNVTALQAVCTLNTLTVTFSADPQADTVFNYQILRAAS